MEEEKAEEVNLAWLKACKGKPNTTDDCHYVYYSNEERRKLAEINPYIDWYSFENQSKKNPYCEKYLEGQEFNITDDGVLIDENGNPYNNSELSEYIVAYLIVYPKEGR